MKSCFKCGIEKPLSLFYKHKHMLDGHLGKCKECTKRDMKRFRREQPARAKAIEERKKDKLYRLKPRIPPKISAEKRAAHIAVGNAVRDGRLLKQPCVICGSSNVEGHHEDYSRKLDVVWLCVLHHRRLHAGDFTLSD